jgi:tRNA(fMet)-specific endonuclease VapC
LRYLFDTDTCVFLRRRRFAGLTQRVMALPTGDAGISVVTYGELAYGAEKSTYRDEDTRKLLMLLDTLEILPLPREAGTFYGSIRADLERRGQMIGANDLWIAAHAMAADLILVTNSEREFRRIDGLKVENWAA